MNSTCFHRRWDDEPAFHCVVKLQWTCKWWWSRSHRRATLTAMKLQYSEYGLQGTLAIVDTLPSPSSHRPPQISLSSLLAPRPEHLGVLAGRTSASEENSESSNQLTLIVTAHSTWLLDAWPGGYSYTSRMRRLTIQSGEAHSCVECAWERSAIALNS